MSLTILQSLHESLLRGRARERGGLDTEPEVSVRNETDSQGGFYQESKKSSLLDGQGERYHGNLHSRVPFLNRNHRQVFSLPGSEVNVGPGSASRQPPVYGTQYPSQPSGRFGALLQSLPDRVLCPYDPDVFRGAPRSEIRAKQANGDALDVTVKFEPERTTGVQIKISRDVGDPYWEVMVCIAVSAEGWVRRTHSAQAVRETALNASRSYERGQPPPTVPILSRGQ